MPIKGDLRAFSGEGIDRAPDEAGVYALYQGEKLIYIGRAEGGLSITTVRARLRGHYEGRLGLDTKEATSYRCEPSTDPVARERELLCEYESVHGRPPRCNPVSYVLHPARRRFVFDAEQTARPKGVDASSDP
jgi:hypothetical protein